MLESKGKSIEAAAEVSELEKALENLERAIEETKEEIETKQCTLNTYYNDYYVTWRKIRKIKDNQ